jgi:hypothetical protein
VATVQHGEQLEVLQTRRKFVRVRTSQGVEGWTDSTLLLTQQQMTDLNHLAEHASKLPSQGAATVFDMLNVHTEPSRPSPSFYQIAEGERVDVVAHRVTKHPDRKQADDWFLVRLRTGKAGWALARNFMMLIPDEVAQYAEGHRITAYVSLGEVEDKRSPGPNPSRDAKHNWLWTTASANLLPYEFDGFRVFVWSTRKQRYETAFIERNVKGYYPVETHPAPGEEGRTFSLVVEEKDGSLYRRTYGFRGYHIRMISKEPFRAPQDLPEVRPAAGFDAAPPEQPAGDSWRGRVRALWKRFGFH